MKRTMKYLRNIKIKPEIIPICILLVLLIFFNIIYYFLHGFLNFQNWLVELSRVEIVKTVLETLIILTFIGFLISIGVFVVKKRVSFLLFEKIYEEFATILVISLIIYIVVEKKETKDIIMPILAVIIIGYSIFIMWLGNRSISIIIQNKYKAEIEKIGSEIKEHFENIWASSSFFIYLQQQIRAIIKSVRAPDDILDEFNPCVGEPNLFDFIKIEKEEHKEILEKIILAKIDEDPVLKILRKSNNQWGPKNRKDVAGKFIDVAKEFKNLHQDDLANYCIQLAKCVYWNNFYEIRPNPPNKEFREIFEIQDKDKNKIYYREKMEGHDVVYYSRHVSISDKDVLSDIEIEFDKERYHYIMKFREYPNIYLLNKTIEINDVDSNAVIFKPQFIEEFKATYGELWITAEAVKEGALEYLMTLGGAYLLKEDWFPIKSGKFYIQHPFQEKVVVEVLNHQNYAYPSEMIRNWKKWMDKFESREDRGRFIWIRESIQPVVNKIKITENIIKSFKNHYENIGIKIEEIDKNFEKKLNELKDKGYLLFFQIHEQFVRTPTTAILIISAENEEDDCSRLFRLTEEFARRQEILKEIFDSLGAKNEELRMNDKIYRKFWEEWNEKEHNFSDPETWIKRGVLGIILREVKCCYALLKIINYYLNSEEYKEILKEEDRKDLKLSKEEIYNFLDREYLPWLLSAVKKIVKNENGINDIIAKNGIKVKDILEEISKFLSKMIDENSLAYIEVSYLREKIKEILAEVSKK